MGRKRATEASDDDVKASKSTNKKLKVSSSTNTNSKPSNASALVSTLVDQSAHNYFVSQKKGNKGIRKEIKQASNQLGDIRVLEEDLKKYEDHIAVPEPGVFLTRDMCHDWLWMLVCNKNLLVYGIGDKRSLLSYFVDHYLMGEDCLEIQGNFHPTHWYDGKSSSAVNPWLRYIKQVLNTIAEDILKDSSLTSEINNNYLSITRIIVDKLNLHYGRIDRSQDSLHGTGSEKPQQRTTRLISSSSSSTHHVTRYNTGRYAHAQTRLFLVIYDIDGSCFHSPEAQACLSLLASSRSISVLASTEHMNYPYFLNTSNYMNGFQWQFFHLPTYIHHPLPVDHPFVIPDEARMKGIMKGGGSGSGGASATHDLEVLSNRSALNVLLPTLSKRHKEFLQMFCQEILTRNTAAATVVIGEAERVKVMNGLLDRNIPLPILLSKGKSKLIVKTKNELQVLLQEFIDHQIVKILQDATTGEAVRILLSEPDIDYIASATAL